ncbi:MAG: hypothetical protein L0I24_24595, partial [Pseudonocardia sp.]|nr:hypothetical protein [Pseudonocardia sp.]
PAELARLCAGALPDLAPLLRSVAVLTAPDGPGEPPRARLLAALAALLRNLAATRPVALLLDDLHLADASSLEALHYLARDCADVPVLVLATARPAELAQHPVAAPVLLGLEQDGRLRRLPVDPLDDDAVRELAEVVTAAPAPAALLGWLDERARGNPLFAIGLLRALLDERADLANPALRRLPEALTERIGIRLRALDPPAVEAAELLAVLGRRCEVRTLVAVLDAPADAVPATLERLVKAGLVTEREQGRELTYELAHPLVAEAVYHGIGGARRRVLHRRAGRALLASVGPGRAAGHFVRSAEPDDDEAIEALRTAVRHAEQAEAYEEALPVLAALVELLPPDDARWGDVIATLRWDAQWVLDHRADHHAAQGVGALLAMDRALAPVDDPAPRAQLKLRLANFLAWGAGELAEAERVCREAVELFTQAGGGRGLLLAEHELAFVRGLRGDTAAMRDGAARVVHAARAADDVVVLGRALRTLDQAAMYCGEFDRAHAANDELIALARAAGDRYREALALTMRGGILVHAGRAADGLAAIDESRRVGGPDRAALP